MVMGPTHAMSGAAFWLAATAFGAGIASFNTSPSLAVVFLGMAVCAGAALAPDIDSHTSTVVNSFGFLGKGLHQVVNTFSVAVYTATSTRRDDPKTNGHRTLFHTSVAAIVAGIVVTLLSSISATFELFNKTYTVGQAFSVLTLAIFLNLAFAGLFERLAKKERYKRGPYLMMLASGIIAIGIFYLLPPDENYFWLGAAVSFGWFMHLLGDMITKMGVPLAWPIKIKGKRWWDVTLPSFLRIKAGGQFEKVFLLPVLTVMTIFLFAYNIPGAREYIDAVLDWIKGILPS